MPSITRSALAVLAAATIATISACGTPSGQSTPTAPASAAADCAKGASATIDTTPSGKYVQGTTSGDVTCLPAGHTVWSLVHYLGIDQTYKAVDGPLQLDDKGHFSYPDTTDNTRPGSTGTRTEFFEADPSQTQQLQALPRDFPSTDLPPGMRKLTGIIGY